MFLATSGKIHYWPSPEKNPTDAHGQKGSLSKQTTHNIPFETDNVHSRPIYNWSHS